MNVLLVSVSGGLGGAERALVECVTALRRQHPGWRVQVLGLEVTAVPPVGDQSASYNVNVRAPDEAQFIIRVDSDADITPGSFVLGNTYDVTGVVSPFGGAEQLYVRSDADIVAVP